MSDQQYGTFESGKEYTLAQIFSDEIRIVIPDLQRDYCWGDTVWDKDGKPSPELVSDFLRSLKEVFDEKMDSKLTLGMFYGYEQPKGHIHLCDGQQRITTLFLLMGVLYRKTKTNPKAVELRKALISDHELKDDYEPHLQYAIRESTLYFVSDLVSKYFLGDGVGIDKLKDEDWYFDEYNQDPTIQSMIEAIKTIEKELAGDFDCDSFGDFILNDLQLLYYDMGSRAQGEESFVVINTTGEPLTAAENLKPVLLGKLDNTQKKSRKVETPEKTDLEFYSLQWEDREEWFWQNRKPNEKIADNGVKEFFEWFLKIKERKDKIADIKGLFPKELSSLLERLNEVHNCFLALKICIELCKNNKQISEVLKTISDGDISLSWFRRIDLNVALPLVAYLTKFQNPKLFYEFVRRIRRNYFDSKRGRDNFVDWRYVVQIIELSNEESDIFSFTRINEFVDIPNVTVKEWYNKDEQVKDTLRKDHKAEIEAWENHSDMMGDLKPIWSANKGQENSFDNLQQIWNMFDLLHKCYDNKKVNELTCQVLSNYVRLYRVVINCPEISHIKQTAGINGVKFSWRDPTSNYYLKYLKDNEFKSLWTLQDQETVLNEIKARLRRLLPRTSVELNSETFNAVKHLKAWLLLKVLSAEANNAALSFYDRNGIASYEDYKRNKLNRDLPFSLANSICGYAKKRGRKSYSRIDYCDNKDYWGSTVCLDTPVGDIITLSDFKARVSMPISIEAIDNVGKQIQILLDRFYGQEVKII